MYKCWQCFSFFTRVEFWLTKTQIEVRAHDRGPVPRSLLEAATHRSSRLEYMVSPQFIPESNVICSAGSRSTAKSKTNYQPSYQCRNKVINRSYYFLSRFEPPPRFQAAAHHSEERRILPAGQRELKKACETVVALFIGLLKIWNNQMHYQMFSIAR